MKSETIGLLLQYGLQLATESIEAHRQSKLDDLTDEQVVESIHIRTPRELIEIGRQKARDQKLSFKTTIAPTPPPAAPAEPDSTDDDPGR